MSGLWVARRSAGAEAVLPSAIPKGVLTELDAKQISSDMSVYAVRRDLWKQIALARIEIENYKNSGLAQAKTLEAARSEIYHLYASPLIMAPSQGNTQELEQEFQAALFNVYRLMGKSLPRNLSYGELSSDEFFVSSATGQSPADQPFAGQYRVECSSYNFIYYNPPRSDSGPAIQRFSVRVYDDSIVYTVAFTSVSATSGAHVDVYMDLNNIRGAGATMLLPPLSEGYLNPEDAWEFALQISRSNAVLYRAGRIQNSVVATFNTRRPFEVSLPRTVLRGNPLRWGYQAALVEPSRLQKGSFEISDFLVKNEAQREKVLKHKPTYLPAARVNK
jgi:hypothetical protein